MMKKFFLLLSFILISFSVFADEWGCDNITKEEMEKAKSVLEAAQEIVLLSYPETKVVKFDDIEYKEEIKQNYESRKFFINDAEVDVSSLFVRFTENTKYLNLGLFIGCDFTSAFDVKEINEDGKVEIKHSVKKAKEMYKACSVQDFSDGKEVDINFPDILTDILYKKVGCYRAALFEFFDAAHPVHSYEYKKAFDDFIAAYKIVRRNIYYIQDGYIPDIYSENRVAGRVLEHVKQIIQDYFDEYDK